MDSNEKVRIALLQMSMEIGNKEANVSKAERMIDEAVNESNPDIVCLPELFNTEYFPQWLHRKYFAYAESIPGPTFNRIRSKAKEHGIYVIAPMYEETQIGVYCNSSPIIGPDGNITGIYRKIHITTVHNPEGGDISYESFYFKGYNELPVFKTHFGIIGQLICYDRHFPECWRGLVLKGATLIIIPVATPGKFLGQKFVSEMQALALINQCFVAVVNRVGVEDKFVFSGATAVINPFGDILAGPVMEKEGIVCAELNLEEIRLARQRYPFIRDRKPELYATFERE